MPVHFEDIVTLQNNVNSYGMFIYVAYKDAPELSLLRRRSSEQDVSIEKTLLVNPNCPVRIMLEYIRKKCRLGTFTQFDLCDEGGALMGLFGLPTYAYATDQFTHKRTYYVIVVKMETDKRCSVLPQLNHDNRLYDELKNRVKNYITKGEASPSQTTPPPGPRKVTPPNVPLTPAKSAMKSKS